MMKLVERTDAFLVETAGELCGFLQVRLRLPYPLALAVISYVAAGMAIAATVAMIGLVRIEGKLIIASWAAALVMMTAFVVRSFLPSIRRWDVRGFLRAHAFAASMRVSTKPIRIASVAGTVVMATLAFAFHDPALAMNSLRYTFVTMVPICIMIYAYSSAPVPTPAILEELRRIRSQSQSQD